MARVTRCLFVLGVVGLLIQPTHAQTTTNQIYTAYAGEVITVSTVSIGFTAATIARGAVTAFCTLASADIRFWNHGTAPSSTVGHAMAAGQSFTLYGATNLSNFRAIRSGGSDGVLTCSYSSAGTVVK